MTENTNYLRVYDFTDGSSNYTVTIKNDLGVVNGLPGQVPPGAGFNMIHTWLIVTDNTGGEVFRYSLSFAPEPDSVSFEWPRLIIGDLHLEDYEGSIGDYRTTEEFIFNISDTEFLTIKNTSKEAIELWAENVMKWDGFSLFHQGPNDSAVNCTMFAAAFLRDFAKINSFIDCYTPMDMSARFYELDAIKKVCDKGSVDFDFKKFVPTERSDSIEWLYMMDMALKAVVATERSLVKEGLGESIVTALPKAIFMILEEKLPELFKDEICYSTEEIKRIIFDLLKDELFLDGDSFALHSWVADAFISPIATRIVGIYEERIFDELSGTPCNQVIQDILQEYKSEILFAFEVGSNELITSLNNKLLLLGIFPSYKYEDFLNEYAAIRRSDPNLINMGADQASDDKVNTLLGTKSGDILKGTDQNDILIGLGGYDKLYGGDGNDIYILGDIFDRGGSTGESMIYDSDGEGQIIYYKNGTAYRLRAGMLVNGNSNPNSRPRYQGIKHEGIDIWYDLYEDGTLKIHDGNTTIAQIANYKKGDLSLVLFDPNESKSGQDQIHVDDPGTPSEPGGAADPPAGAYHIVQAGQGRSLEDPYYEIYSDNQSDVILGSAFSEVIRALDGDDYIIGGKGNDYIYGGDGNDYLVGGLSPVNALGEVSSSSSSGFVADGTYQDDDYIIGGAGQDMIIGGLGDDIIIAGEAVGEEGSTAATGDWVAGGQGDDIIFGSRNRDILMGGAGRDFIAGKGGDDIIFGDGDEYQAAYYSDRFTIEFSKVMYKNNEGLLWKTSIGPDGTPQVTEVTDEYKIDPHRIAAD